METSEIYFYDLSVGELFTEDCLKGVIYQKINPRLAKCIKSEKIKEFFGTPIVGQYFGYGPDCKILKIVEGK